MSQKNKAALERKIDQVGGRVKHVKVKFTNEDVRVLKESVQELMERVKVLEIENAMLKARATSETLAKLKNIGKQQSIKEQK